MKVGTHKKTVIALWLVLIASVSFGVYKNFTAIDMHTVHEKEVIEQRIVDTNKIENFVKAFAKSYYSWSNTQESIEKRTTAINQYLTKSLQDLNVDTVRQDIPTSSTVTDVKIWDIKQAGTTDFTVVYSIDQTVTEGETSIVYTSAYMVVVHVDGDGNLVIIQNPTISSIPTKSSYEPKAQESDGTVDAATTEEVTEFLETFFKLYPTATEKELAYYKKKANRYGTPLDSRAAYTKSDWILWCAAMDNTAALIQPVAAYLKETKTRVPFSDWYQTDSGRYCYFIARSVQGGIFMPMLAEQIK